MNRLVNLTTNGNISTVLFLTNDVSLVNMLRRAIMSEIETYAVDYVTFNINTSYRHDEILALRIGQCVINNDEFQYEEGRRYEIDVTGPGEFTTDDIKDIPYKFKTPILSLYKNHRIKGEVVIKKGTCSDQVVDGKIIKGHVNFKPISVCYFDKVENGYLFTIETIGMLSPEEIFRRGYQKIENAINQKPINLFFQQLVPNNY